MERTSLLAPAIIKEEFYNRQLYVFNHEELHKIETANVLVLGLKGLGVEIGFCSAPRPSFSFSLSFFLFRPLTVLVASSKEPGADWCSVGDSPR
jgi:hypothetical protein